MFLPNSRYANVPTVTLKLRDGREVTALKLRSLPPTGGRPCKVSDNDRLDLMAQATYGEGTQFWHIADANTELRANDLLTPVGRVIGLPET